MTTVFGGLGARTPAGVVPPHWGREWRPPRLAGRAQLDRGKEGSAAPATFSCRANAVGRGACRGIGPGSPEGMESLGARKLWPPKEHESAASRGAREQTPTDRPTDRPRPTDRLTGRPTDHPPDRPTKSDRSRPTESARPTARPLPAEGTTDRRKTSPRGARSLALLRSRVACRTCSMTFWQATSVSLSTPLQLCGGERWGSPSSTRRRSCARALGSEFRGFYLA